MDIINLVNINFYIFNFFVTLLIYLIYFKPEFSYIFKIYIFFIGPLWVIPNFISFFILNYFNYFIKWINLYLKGLNFILYLRAYLIYFYRYIPIF